MRTAASEIAAAPSVGCRILISSSSFSPAATLNEAVPDMAERAATSQQGRRAHTLKRMHKCSHTHLYFYLSAIDIMYYSAPYSNRYS